MAVDAGVNRRVEASPPVVDVEEDSDAALADRRALERVREERRVNSDEYEEDAECRQQATSTAKPELPGDGAARLVEVDEQQRGDQIARKDEKDVDAKPSSFQPAR